MNIFHYILITWLVLAGFSLTKDAVLEKNKIRTVLTVLIVLLWVTLIILSAYY